MRTPPMPCHVSLVTLPETSLSALAGLYEVLNAFARLGPECAALSVTAPLRPEIVTPGAHWATTASGLPVAGRPFTELARTGIVLVPPLFPRLAEPPARRYPDLVDWIARMHRHGAILAAAGSAVTLLAETGRLDGGAAAIPAGDTGRFRRLFPDIDPRPDHPLVVSGAEADIVTSGAPSIWHDLALYLIARVAGPRAAQEIARLFALRCDGASKAIYADFRAPAGHGDALVRAAQAWLAENAASPHPVEAVCGQSAAATRTFKRRFAAATGHSVLSYVQRLRVEDAKRRLEGSDQPVDEIAWSVGYEDPAFFRRLFKRLTGVSPAQYRRSMRIPGVPGRGPTTVELRETAF